MNKKTILSLYSSNRSEFCWMIYVTSYQGNSMNLSSRLSSSLCFPPSALFSCSIFFSSGSCCKKEGIPEKDCFLFPFLFPTLTTVPPFSVHWFIGRQIYSLHLHHQVIRRRETVRKFFSFPIVSIVETHSSSFSFPHFSIDLQCYKHIIKRGRQGY